MEDTVQQFFCCCPQSTTTQAKPVFPWHPSVWKQEVLQQVAEIKSYNFVGEIELWISEAKSWDEPGCKGWSRILAFMRFQRWLLLLIHLILPKDLCPPSSRTLCNHVCDLMSWLMSLLLPSALVQQVELCNEHGGDTSLLLPTPQRGRNFWGGIGRGKKPWQCLRMSSQNLWVCPWAGFEEQLWIKFVFWTYLSGRAELSPHNSRIVISRQEKVN